MTPIAAVVKVVTYHPVTDRQRLDQDLPGKGPATNAVQLFVEIQHHIHPERAQGGELLLKAEDAQ